MSSRQKYSYAHGPRTGGYATAVSALGGSDLPIESILAESPASAAVKDEIVKMVFAIAKADAPDAAASADVDASSRARFINSFINRKSLDARPGPVCGTIAKALNDKLKMGINLNDTPEGVCRSVLSRLAELGIGLEQEHTAADAAYRRYIQDLEESLSVLIAIIPRLNATATTNQASAQAALKKVGDIADVLREQINMLRGSAGKGFSDRSKYVARAIDQADFATALRIATGDRADSTRKNVYLIKILDIIKPLALVSAISKKSLADLGVDVERVRALKKNGKTIVQITDELLAEKSTLGQITRSDDIDRLNRTIGVITSIYNGAAVEAFSGGASSYSGGLYPELGARGGEVEVPGRLNQSVMEEARRIELKGELVKHDYVKESFNSSYVDSLSALNLALADVVADTTLVPAAIERKDQRYIRFRQALTSLATRNERYVGKLFSGLYSDANSLEVKSKYIVEIDELIASLPLFGELIGSPPSITRAVAQLGELRALLAKWRGYAEKSKLSQQIVYPMVGGLEVVPSMPRRVGNVTISVAGLSQFQTLLEAAIDKTAITANFTKSSRNEAEVGQRQQSLASTFVAGYVTRIDQLVDLFERLSAKEITDLIEKANKRRDAMRAVTPTIEARAQDEDYRSSLAQIDNVKLVVNELRDIIKQQTDVVKEMFQLLASVNTYVMESIAELSAALAASTFRTDELSQLVDQLRAPALTANRDTLTNNISALQAYITSEDLKNGCANAFVAQVFNKTRDLAFDIFKRMTPMYNFLLIVEKVGPSSISKIKAGVVLDTMGKYLATTFLRIQKHTTTAGLNRQKEIATVATGTASLRGMERLFESEPGHYRDDVDAFKQMASQLRVQPLDAAIAYVAGAFVEKTMTGSSGPHHSFDQTRIALAQAATNQPAGPLSTIASIGAIASNRAIPTDGRVYEAFSRRLQELGVSIDKITFNGAKHIANMLSTGALATSMNKDDVIAPDEVIAPPEGGEYQVRVFDLADRSRSRFSEQETTKGPYRLVDLDRGVARFIPVPALAGIKFQDLVKKLEGKPNWPALFVLANVSDIAGYNQFVQLYALLYSARGGGFSVEKDSYELVPGSTTLGTFVAKSNFVLVARKFMQNAEFILSNAMEGATLPTEQLSSKAMESPYSALLF